VTTNQRRAAVTHLRAHYPVSDRRACRLVRLSRSRWQYRSTRLSDGPLAAALKAKAEQRPRWGYRRLALLLRRDGWVVNSKRVLRVYRAEGLRLRRRGRRKQVSTARVPAFTRPAHEGPNTQWTLDFITDAFVTGRQFRTLSVVDECTRECLVLHPDVSLPSAKVVAALEAVVALRGAPERIVLDNALPSQSRVEGDSAIADALGVRRLGPCGGRATTGPTDPGSFHLARVPCSP
jgi:putative transposase